MGRQAGARRAGAGDAGGGAGGVGGGVVWVWVTLMGPIWACFSLR
jgi:hypothetical protein